MNKDSNNNSKYANQEALKQYHKLKKNIKNIMRNNGKSIGSEAEMFIPSVEKFKEVTRNKDFIKSLQMKLKSENVATNIADYDLSDCLTNFEFLILANCTFWGLAFLIWVILWPIYMTIFFEFLPVWPIFIFGTISYIYFDKKNQTSVWQDNLQIFMSILPFDNKYSFCKILRKLKRLEKKYDDVENFYSEYLGYIKRNDDEKNLDFVDGVYDEIDKNLEETTARESVSRTTMDYGEAEKSKGKALVWSLKRKKN